MDILILYFKSQVLASFRTLKENKMQSRGIYPKEELGGELQCLHGRVVTFSCLFLGKQSEKK